MLKYALTAVALLAAGWLLLAKPPETDFRRESAMDMGAKTVRVIFGGDMMFDRSIRVVAQEKGDDFLFSCIDRVLKSADFVVANLEGPITANTSRSVGSVPGGKFNTTFTFPTTTAALLVRHNIKIVNIGNNHILDFGRDGIRATLEALDAVNVHAFGDPFDTEGIHEHQGELALAFINYNQFTPLPDAASSTIAAIQAAKAEGHIPVVYTHWGTEYVPATAGEKKLAHEFIDAGAELVIGSHPHVVQEHEVYKGKHIYYSLGNFIFDQYFQDEVRQGLLLDITFDEGGVKEIKEISVTLQQDRRTCPGTLTIS